MIKIKFNSESTTMRCIKKNALDCAERTTESASVLVHILEVDLIREEGLIFSDSESRGINILRFGVCFSTSTHLGG